MSIGELDKLPKERDDLDTDGHDAEDRRQLG
jgi:hypothetical protein